MATKTERRTATQNRLVAMSHPLRAQVLNVLNERTASPKEIADQLGEPIPNVSHHAKRLVQLGCAELVDKRQVRGAIEHFYRAIERPWVDAEEWNELDPLVAENFVCAIMQSGLDDFISSVKAKMVGSDERFVLSRTRLHLDEQGMSEALEIQERARGKSWRPRLGPPIVLLPRTRKPPTSPPSLAASKCRRSTARRAPSRRLRLRSDAADRVPIGRFAMLAILFEVKLIRI